MTDRTLTVAGARGRSGTTTTAAASRCSHPAVPQTELVPTDIATTAALLGVTAAAIGAIDAEPDPTLVKAATGHARDLGCHAGRLDQLTDTPAGLLLIVLRGRDGCRPPTAFRPRDRPGGRCGPQPDHRDVCDVWGARRRASPHDRERCSHDRRRPPDHPRARASSSTSAVASMPSPSADAETSSRRRHPANSNRQHLPTGYRAGEPSPRLSTLLRPRLPSKSLQNCRFRYAEPAEVRVRFRRCCGSRAISAREPVGDPPSIRGFDKGTDEPRRRRWRAPSAPVCTFGLAHSAASNVRGRVGPTFSRLRIAQPAIL